MKKKSKNVAIYCRTSREFKNVEGVSIPQQIKDGKSFVKKHPSLKLTLDENNIFIDRDKSGSLPPKQWAELSPVYQSRRTTKTREAFTNLIDAIVAGKVNAVIVRKINRLMRGFLLHRKFHGLCDKYDVKIYCTAESFCDSDSSSDDPAHNFNSDMQALIAEYQLKLISSDIKSAKKYLKDKGKKNAPVKSIGYMESKDEKGVAIDEYGKQIVLKVFHLFTKRKMLVNQIADYCNKHYDINKCKRNGVNATRFTHSTVSKILKNNAYIGLTTNSNGETITSAAYDKIIEPDIFYTAQKILAGHHNFKTGNRYKPHLLGGMLRCKNCGTTLNCKLSKNNGIPVDHVYNCVNKECIGSNKSAGIKETSYQDWIDKFFHFSLKTELENTMSNEEFQRLNLEIEKKTQDRYNLLNNTKIDTDSAMIRASALKKDINTLEVKINKLKVQLGVTTTYKPWNDLTVFEKKQRIKEMIETIIVSKQFVFVTLRPTFYKHIIERMSAIFDMPEIKHDNTSDILELAFPIMGLRGAGSNYCKVLVPPNSKDVSIKQSIYYIETNPYLVVDWENSTRKSKPVLEDRYFKYWKPELSPLNWTGVDRSPSISIHKILDKVVEKKIQTSSHIKAKRLRKKTK